MSCNVVGTQEVLKEKMYTPNPIDVSDVELSPEMLELTELIARNVHEVWAEGRIREGWVWGMERNDDKKTTPCLVPYESLPDFEKQYDRNTALSSIRLLVKLGYKITKE